MQALRFSHLLLLTALALPMGVVPATAATVSPVLAIADQPLQTAQPLKGDKGGAPRPTPKPGPRDGGGDD